MLTLGIETSGRNATVALLEGATVLSQRSLSENDRPDTRRLPVCVQEILAEHKVKPKQLNCLAVSRGPGSFTGLRVGLVFAKTFGYASGVPLVAVDSFAATVERIIPGTHIPAGEKIEVVEDLRKGQIAWQRFEFRSGTWDPENEIAVSSIREWVSLPHDKVFLTGLSIERIEKQLTKEQSLDAKTILPEQYRSPDAVAVALLGQKELEQNGPVNPFELKPLYIRRSSAEEKRTQTSRGR